MRNILQIPQSRNPKTSGSFGMTKAMFAAHVIPNAVRNLQQVSTEGHNADPSLAADDSRRFARDDKAEGVRQMSFRTQGGICNRLLIKSNVQIPRSQLMIHDGSLGMTKQRVCGKCHSERSEESATGIDRGT